MSDSGTIQGAESLPALFDAFNRHDVDSVMSVFADDCVFFAVAGDEVYGSKTDGADLFTLRMAKSSSSRLFANSGHC